MFFRMTLAPNMQGSRTSALQPNVEDRATTVPHFTIIRTRPLQP